MDKVQNAVEVAWMFDSLVDSGNLPSWDTLIDQWNGSQRIREEIAKIADNFEEECFNDSEYLSKIQTYAKEKLMETFSLELEEIPEKTPSVEEPIWGHCREKALDFQDALLEYLRSAKRAKLFSFLRVEENRVIFASKKDALVFKNFLDQFHIPVEYQASESCNIYIFDFEFAE